MGSWHFNPIFSGYLILVMAGVLMAATLVPPFKPISGRQRATLIALRVLVILLATILMLRPTHESRQSRLVSALLVLMMDVSRSMQVPDLPAGQSRFAGQRETFTAAADVLRQMPKNIDVEIYTYDAKAEPLALGEGTLPLPETPQGDSTDIGSSLDDVLQQARGRRLAAVVLAGDGAQRAFNPRAEMQAAARELNRLGAPLYTMTLGKDLEKSQARDVEVANLREEYSVFVKNELILTPVMNVRGYLNQPIGVELVIEDASGKQTVLGPVQKSASENGQQLPLRFTFTPQEPGQYRLTLQADELPGELVTKNNTQTAFLNVLDGGLKVFYADTLRPERMHLPRSLAASEDIQLLVADTDPLRKDWPRNYAETFADPEFDVFILGNLPAAAFTPESLAALETAVENGKGFIMLGGDYSFGPGAWAGTPVARLLPLSLDANEKDDLDNPIRKDRHWPGPLAARPARGHYLTALGAADQNAALWDSLSPLLGANKFDRLSSTAMVLLESPDRKPLLVAGNYGDGRVLAMAGDSTWQWRLRDGRVDLHQRFWRQVVLWLARKDGLEEEDVWIRLDQRRFNSGSRVEFTTGANRSDGPVRDATFTATVTLPDGSKKPARLSPDGDQQLGLFKETAQPGQYTIEVVARRQGVPLKDEPARSKFLVLDTDLELSDPSANPAALAAMAELTADHGGRAITREELVPILEEIRSSPPQLREEVEERFELGRTAGTAWLFFLVIVAALGAEWALRKKWGLV